MIIAMALLAKDIVESYGKLPRKVIDILQDIKRADLEDLEILESWKRFYTAKKIPWAVTTAISHDQRRVFKLWIPL